MSLSYYFTFVFEIKSKLIKNQSLFTKNGDPTLMKLHYNFHLLLLDALGRRNRQFFPLLSGLRVINH